MGKFVSTEGVTYSVYTTMVEPFILYKNRVWETKTFIDIFSVQTRACKYFLFVGK